MVTRKRKLLRTEANIVASIDEELANESDSDADCVPEISISEERADENDVSDWGPGPCIDGFVQKIVNQVFPFSQEIQEYNLPFKIVQNDEIC
jgi:hypothetical protein